VTVTACAAMTNAGGRARLVDPGQVAMKVLLELADESFVISSETAAKVERFHPGRPIRHYHHSRMRQSCNRVGINLNQYSTGISRN
jgi:hypothetical protein